MEGRTHSGGAQEFGQRSQPRAERFWGGTITPFLFVPPSCTFAKALFCRRRRRASGAFEGLPALKPVFDSPYACAVPQLGPQKRNERKRAGNLFRIGCDSEASRSHGLTRGGAILLSASSFSAAPRARSPPPARAQGAPPPAQRQTSSGGGLMSGLMGTVAQVRAQRGAGEGAKFPCAAAVGRRLVAVRLDGARARPSWAPWGDMHGLYARDPLLRRPRAHELGSQSTALCAWLRSSHTGHHRAGGGRHDGERGAQHRMNAAEV